MAKQQWYQLIPRIRFIIAIIAFLLIAFCVAVIVLGSNSSSNDIFFAILAGVGAFLGLFAWFFPFSPKQPVVSRLPLARELVRGSFKMGDEAAANFPYITVPIQGIYTEAKQAFLGSSTGANHKRGVLILGEANAGKTRLAFEALTQTLPDWPVLRWWPDSTMDRVSLHEKHLIIFIDDVQEYVSIDRKVGDTSVFIADPRATTLRTLLDRARQEIPRVVVVAICRLEDKERVQAELGQLFNELEVLQLPTFNVDDHDPEAAKIIADFQRHGSTHIQDWDGTLGSLVLGLLTKSQEYLKIRNAPAAVILRAMKLLTKATILRHTERLLLAVGIEIFGEKILLDEQKWQEAKTLLIQGQFVTEGADQDSQGLILVIRKDTYFEKVITDYPTFKRPHQLLHDLIRLQSVLVTLKDASGLFDLGVTLGKLERYEEALQAYEQAIELDPKDADAYYNKGATFADLKRYEEALQAFERAIELDPKNESIQIEKMKLLREIGYKEDAELG